MMWKERLIRSTMPGSTPNSLAILRTPLVRPGALRAAPARVGHYSFCAFKLLTFFVSQCHDDRIFIDAKELGRVVVGITED
jgi:hypothetical protein